MRRRWLILLLGCFLLFDLLGFSPPRSKQFKHWGWITAMGTSPMRSANYIIRHVIGDTFVGVIVKGMKKITSGFFTVLTILGQGPEEGGAYDIDWISAYTHQGGSKIYPGRWQSDPTPYFVWEIKNPQFVPAGYSYSLDSEPDDEIDTTSKFADYKDNPISDGKHTFYVKAQNSAGVWGEMGSFAIWVDTKPPGISRVEPKSGTLLNTRDEAIRIWIEDEASGVDARHVVCRINNRRVYLKFDDDCGCFVNYGILPEGKVTVSVEASDLAGNKATAFVWGFSVDTIPPTGSVQINHGAKYTNSITVLLTLSAQDNYSGVSKVRIGNSRVECESSAWTDYREEVEWRLRPYNGRQTVFVQFMDKAGNVSRVYSSSITLELLAPDTVIVTGPAGVTKQTDAYFRYRCSLDKCYYSYSLDGGKWSKWSKEDSVLLVNLAPGRHVFSVRASADVNHNHVIDEEEIDPTPAQRTWFVGELGLLKRMIRFRFWRVE